MKLFTVSVVLAVATLACCVRERHSTRQDRGSGRSGGNSSSGLCRFRGRYLGVAEFRLNTCVKCLEWIPGGKGIFRSTEDKNQAHLVLEYKYNVDWNRNKKRHFFIENLVQFFNDPQDMSLLVDCCLAAESCCERIKVFQEEDDILQVGAPAPDSPEKGCVPTWDGWQCWEEMGAPGEMEYNFCPDYIYFLTHSSLRGVNCHQKAEKLCTSDGWYRQRTRNGTAEWTDFNPCNKDTSIITMEHIRLSLYAVSAVALAPAILIFQFARSLQVTRIRIHKHLFISLLLFTITTSLFRLIYLLPSMKPLREKSPLDENGIPCRLLIILSKYFRLSNYAWMWGEGYYLHKLLTNTFEDQTRMAMVFTIGWGLPMIPTILYGIFKSQTGETNCWAYPSEEEWVEWFFYLPGLLAIATNIIFFINIFRILMTKLRSPHQNEPTSFRRAVRACYVLVPLFGLQWLITLFRVKEGSCYLVAGYKYVDILIDTLQGLVVAYTFCYRTEEITSLVVRKLEIWREEWRMRRSRASCPDRGSY